MASGSRLVAITHLNESAKGSIYDGLVSLVAFTISAIDGCSKDVITLLIASG